MRGAPRPPAADSGRCPRLVADGPVRTVLVGRRGLGADLLAAALRRSQEVRLVGTAEDAEEAAALLARRPADLALVRGDGARAALVKEVARLGEWFPQLEIAVLGVADEDVADLAEAGATGYVSRNAGLTELLHTVGALRAGRSRCTPRVAAALVARLRRRAEGRAPGASSVEITARERQVLDAVSRGLTNKEIAQELGVAVSTIKNHVHSILRKLGAGSRRKAVQIAYEHGLTEDYLPVQAGTERPTNAAE